MSNIRFLERARDFIEVVHEATRLYESTKTSWTDRVAFFNNNPAARDRLINDKRTYLGSTIAQAKVTGGNTLTCDLLTRKSTRTFANSSLPLETITELVSRCVMSNMGTGIPASSGRPPNRPYGSAGGIYSVEHYVIGLSVEGFGRPFTAYCSPGDCNLIMVNDQISRDEAMRALGIAQKINFHPAFALVQTLNLERATRKYQERGYRFALIEAGLAAQTLCLVALSLQIGSLIWGGHHDHLLDKMLGISSPNETATNTIFFGTSV